MKSKYKIIMLIVVILIIVLSVIGVIYFKSSDNTEETPVKVVDSVDGFMYELKDNDSKLKKELFYELKKELENDDINYQSYAELLSKIFVVDVFSLDNKLNKYDIGGLDFILESEKEKFRSLMGDTLYDILENNFDGGREQELPQVKEILVEGCTESKITIDNEELLAYDIVLNWTYEVDLGYDTSATVKVVKKDNKMYIVSYNPNA